MPLCFYTLTVVDPNPSVPPAQFAGLSKADLVTLDSAHRLAAPDISLVAAETGVAGLYPCQLHRERGRKEAMRKRTGEDEGSVSATYP